MKIKSFGCSFIYGSDLSDQFDHDIPPFARSDFTWPALLAKKYNLDHECFAEPGQGNFKILCDLIAQASLSDPALVIVNWTWIDRFDYTDSHEQWKTLRPSEDTSIEKFYYRHLHSQLNDVLKSVYYINTAIDFLLARQYPFIMTYMDYNLLIPFDPNWHDPRYLEIIQKKISKYLHTFEEKNFLDWSRDQGFAVSDRWHPLEQAHQSAAEYISPKIESILRDYQKEK
jgi:hypothetical protein